MKVLLYCFIFIFFAPSLTARADSLNNYRWNRSNQLAENGKIDQRPWYEWWYYKIVIPESDKAFFMVYGVVNPWDFSSTMQGTRANVGFGDFGAMTQSEQKFPLKEFYAKYNETYVELGSSNIATDKYFKGMIKGEQGELVSWDVAIEKKWAFNATSWLTGRGITNIEWYPAQASAHCSGSIVSAHKTYQFENVPCYQDRNWGHSFPEWWAWIVANSFENSPDTALAIGGGRPKILNRFDPIENVAVGFLYKGKEYTWRINEFDHIKIDISFGKWIVSAKNKSHSIEIEAFAPIEKFMDLKFRTPDGVIFHDYEALLGDLNIKFYKNHGNKKILIEALKSKHAGIEYGSENIYSLEALFTGTKNIYSN